MIEKKIKIATLFTTNVAILKNGVRTKAARFYMCRYLLQFL